MDKAGQMMSWILNAKKLDNDFPAPHSQRQRRPARISANKLCNLVPLLAVIAGNWCSSATAVAKKVDVGGSET